MSYTNLTLPTGLVARGKVQAALEQRSLSAVVTELLGKYLDEQGTPSPD